LSETRGRVIEAATGDPAAVRAVLETLAPLAGVTSTSEYYLDLCAMLAAEHGLPGNPADAVMTCRDKGRTRAALSAAGLPQPRWEALSNPDGVMDAVARVGLPCVVKPADGSGSTLVRLCDTVEAVEKQVSEILAVTHNARGLPTVGVAVIEEFLDGPEFSVEMFSIDGRHELVGVTRKTVGPQPFFVETGHLFPAGEQIEGVGQALDAAGIQWGATHTEVRLTPRGPVVVEINARLAGGMIPELVRLATGVDLLEQQLRAAIGLPLLLAPTRERFAGIRFLLAPTAGLLARVHGLDEARRVPGVDRVVVTAAEGAAVLPARDFSHRLGYAIAAGQTPDAVEAALAQALSCLRIELS
jgi:biotin carboxylase